MTKLVPSVAVLLAALMTPVTTNAECVTVTAPPSKSEPRAQFATPSLIFSGTVTAIDIDRYLASFQVERVWSGQLRRESKFFISPVLEGAQVSSFRVGVSYLVTVLGPVQVIKADEASSEYPAGTVLVAFGCSDGPRLLAEAKDYLARLGRGRAPTP